jgi:hypothetical protein
MPGSAYDVAKSGQRPSTHVDLRPEINEAEVFSWKILVRLFPPPAEITDRCPERRRHDSPRRQEQAHRDAPLRPAT